MLNVVEPRCFSLFAGAGGCSFGFKQAGFRVAYAVDIDHASCMTYRHNFPNTVVDTCDIADIDWQKVLTDQDLAPGELEMLIGGPPCQGFSSAGKRLHNDPRNYLLDSYVKALSVLQPKWFMMENVEGLLTLDNGKHLFRTVEAFTNIGYTLRLEKVYAHEYGVPQRRKRVIIIGNRLGANFSFPPPTTTVRGKIFRNGANNFSDALHDLPAAYALSCPKKAKTHKPQGHFFLPPQGTNMNRIRHLQPGQSMRDLPPSLQHDSFQRRALRRVMDGTPSEKRGGAPSGLKRLISTEPSLTITSASTREFIHPIENRCLTIRECARLQTFPDNFEFYGSAAEQIKQIGNAVPPLLARIFAEHILDLLVTSSQPMKMQAKLLGFSLTKAEAMSPALQRTQTLLNSISTFKGGRVYVGALSPYPHKLFEKSLTKNF